MVKLRRTERWYQSRLSRYFDEHFIGYEDTATWYINPAPNQWLFDVPETGERFELTCDDRGNITVEKYPARGLNQ